MSDSARNFIVADRLPDIEYTTDSPEEIVCPRVVVRDGVAMVYVHKERHAAHGGHVPVETFFKRLAASEPGLMVTGYRQNGRQTTISFNKRNRVKLSARLQRFLAELQTTLPSGNEYSRTDKSKSEPFRDTDQIEAARIMSELVPDTRQRTVVLGQLVRSADFANSVAPDAWAVTLFAWGFRLNVGQVETLIFIDGKLRVLLTGGAGAPRFVGERSVARIYKSVPEPQSEFFGSIEEFENAQEQMQRSHMNFIRLAATTKSGEPRDGTPHLHSHSAGLLAYAKEFLQSLDGVAAEAPTAEDDIARATDLPDDVTERQAVIAARRGQGRFRDELLREWGGCAVTECRNGALLRASHIKPWRDSSNRERLSPDNGLLLSAHLDAAFDRGLISFSDDGCLLIHPDRFSEDDAKALGIHPSLKLRRVRSGHASNLAAHRKMHGFK